MKKKFLIIRFSSIGDIVLTTPVIRCLKKKENVEIHYCTKKQFKAILESNPYVDKIHTLDSNLWSLARLLRKEKFDAVIDLHRNLRSWIIKLVLKVKAYSFNKLNWEKWLLVNFKINKLPNKHIVDRYMDTIVKLGVKNDQKGLDYFIPYKDEVALDWLPKDFKKGYVAYAIGGQHETKKLPIKRIIGLCDQINMPVLLLGSKEDKPNGDAILSFFESSPQSAGYELKLKEELGKKTTIFNACGKFNLNQSASLIKQAKCIFTHDTGLMHIAAAFKKPVYSIWGNTVPAFGMYPYQTRFTTFENNKLSCRPCSKIGYSKCPLGHFKCMNDLIIDIYLG